MVPLKEALLPMPAGGEPSREGRWNVFTCSDLRISSRSARRCAAPCAQHNASGILGSKAPGTAMSAAPYDVVTAGGKVDQQYLGHAPDTLQRRCSSSVEGSSLKGTGTATGGQGPAALTTC
jgi:hypothetical protein